MLTLHTLTGIGMLGLASFLGYVLIDRGAAPKAGAAAYLFSIVAVLLQIGAIDLNLRSSGPIGGDNLQVVNFAKNYVNANGFQFNPNLGFPGVMDNEYFPTFDFSYRALLRLTSIFSADAILNYHLLYIIGPALMVLSAITSLRFVGFPAWLSIIGSAVFIVSPFFVFRALVHDFLSLYFSVPLGAALAIIMASSSDSPAARKTFPTAFTMVSIFVISTSGLYYAFFSSMFLVLSGLIGSIRKRRLLPFLSAVLIVAVIFSLMVITGYESGLYDVLAGKIPQVSRLPVEQLSYGLNLAEALHVLTDVPYMHHLIEPYLTIMSQMWGANGLFDWPGLALTVVILLSPLILAIMGSTRAGQRGSPAYAAAACATFGLFYAVRGGLGYYVNIFITPQIRAPDRILPFLSFFALVLMLSAVCSALRSNVILIRTIVPAVFLTALAASMMSSENGLFLKRKEWHITCLAGQMIS